MSSFAMLAHSLFTARQVKHFEEGPVDKIVNYRVLKQNSGKTAYRRRRSTGPSQ